MFLWCNRPYAGNLVPPPLLWGSWRGPRPAARRC